MQGGGETVVVGVMMLDTRFPRHPRDIGQSLGLPFEVRHRRVARASVGRVVRSGPPDPDLLAPFVEAGLELAAGGASVLTTSCGFLHPWQSPLARRLPVPFVASALALLPGLERRLPAGSRIGVLTFDAAAFAGARLDPAGRLLVEAPAPGCHFRAVIEEGRRRDDPARLARDVRAAARRLAARGPAAVVLECTNLAPWRDVVTEACGVPVFDLIDAIDDVLTSPPGSRSR